MFEFDEDELNKKLDEANSQKKTLATVGAIGDALANNQSFGNYFLGQMNPKKDISGSMAKIAEGIEDPLERQAKVYAQYKKVKEMKDLGEADKQAAALKDPNSQASKAAKYFFQKKGFEIGDDDSADSLTKRFGDSKDYALAGYKTAIDQKNNMSLQALKNQSEKEKAALELAKTQMVDAGERGTLYGMARTKDDAKQLKEASETKSKFDNALTEMIALRKEYGGELMNREAVARGKQLSKDLLLQKKKLESLGVLSQSDMEIVNAIIPEDPLAFDGLPGQDPIMSNLEKFKQDSDNDFQVRLKNRLTPEAYSNASAGADEKTKLMEQMAQMELLKRKKKISSTAAR